MLKMNRYLSQETYYSIPTNYSIEENGPTPASFCIFLAFSYTKSDTTITRTQIKQAECAYGDHKTTITGPS